MTVVNIVNLGILHICTFAYLKKFLPEEVKKIIVWKDRHMDRQTNRHDWKY